MKLTPQVETEGLRAYEKARAFERLRAWRLPVSYLIFSLIPLLTGAALLKVHHERMAEFHFAAALFFATASWFHWHWLLNRYRHHLKFLAGQEAVYGEQLPWVQVEKHLAALDRLQRELAQEKIAAALKDVKADLERSDDPLK